MGNMIEAMKAEPEKYAMANPENFEELEGELKEKEQKLVEDCGHLDWTEDCKYMCMNAFGVLYDKESKKFKDYRVLEVKQNGAYHEFYSNSPEE